MVPPAVFGIESNALDTAFKLLVLVLVVVWLALVWFTFADARRRIADPLLIATATVAAFIFPFVGTIVYMIVRPPEYLDDVRERELEIQAVEARLHEQDVHFCPHCEYQVEKAFLRCPNCLRKLKDPCQVCGKPLDPEWKICPYCEAEIPGKTPRRRRRRPPAEAEQQPAGAEAPPS
jgi:double zinc ribbon protein